MRILNKTLVNIFDCEPTFKNMVAFLGALLGFALSFATAVGMFVSWSFDWALIRLIIVGLIPLALAYYLWPTSYDE